MALTLTKREHSVFGNKRYHIYTVTFDNSYPTGGEAVTPGNFGMNNIDYVIVQGVTTAGTRLVAYDRANKKLKVFTALSTEAVNASDQSTVSVEVVVVGI